MAVISGGAASDSLLGTGNADEISGLGGDDTLAGGGGNDTLIGGTGADSLVGGAGADSLVGGGGNDVYVIDASDILVDSGGVDTVRAGFSYELLAGFENLVLLGAAAIHGTGNGAANAITGNSAGNLLSGSGGDDTLDGGGGNDTLIGGTGADSLKGGSGDDTYTIDGLDLLEETTGIDTVRAGFSYTLLSRFENLVLLGTGAIDGTGNGLANTLTGNDAINKLNGGSGNDTLIGGAEADSLVGGPGDDVLVHDAADSRVNGGAGTDTLRMNGGGLALDLTAVPDGVHVDIEVIDITGSGANDLILSVADAAAISSTTDTLRVGGNKGDAVATADGGWLHTQGVVIGAQAYSQYVNGSVTLLVDTDIDRGGIDITLSSIALSSLNGTNGFRIDGIDAGDASGTAVAGAGDVNGDGFEDVIIGAPGAAGGGDAAAGESYVVFGKAGGFGSAIDLASLDGTNGFRIDGIDVDDSSGHSVAGAGDVNGDGFDDLIIGAYRAGGEAGESYVVFGKASGFGMAIDLASLNGTTGFRIDGIDADDWSGRWVAAAGDVNGDGFDDVVIGAYRADPGGDSAAGESYVVFGKASGFNSSLDLASLNGANGFRIDGIDADDSSGRAVAGAGDVNGDGFDDLIIGARYADPGGDSRGGESYVVFGKVSGFNSALDLTGLNGTTGFRIDGINAGDLSGYSVAAAGDVNGDGFADLIIGASYAYSGGDSAAGETYVVFGKASGFGSALDLNSLDGSNGFRIGGIDSYDLSGRSVSAAGDVNGDGFDDVVIAAVQADPGGNTVAGETYVVFGKASGFGSVLELSGLDGTNGFRIDGIDPADYSGQSLAAAGDVNGDGFDDLIVAASTADPGGDSAAGESYVIFGADFTGAVTHLGTVEADSLTGAAAAERFVSGLGNDTLTGGGGADVFNGGAGNDLIRVSSTSFQHVDGGSGNDTLAILGAGRTLNLVARLDNEIIGIETIAIGGSGDNILRLARGDLFDLSDTTNQLRVTGDADDTVDLVGAWSDDGVSGAFHVYTSGAATILIDTDIFVT